MNKRDLVLSLIDGKGSMNYIPAAFFLHFDPLYHRGQAAVDKHLEFFDYTGMDIVKIQYEHHFPKKPSLIKPEDWENLPVYDDEFFEEPITVVRGLVERAKKDALVIVTLYSPFMVAGQFNGQETITEHILNSPSKAKKGMEIVTQSMLNFVRACVRVGVDGFYTSTQGAETFRFPNLEPFFECIKPFDLAIMNELKEISSFNILHVCDYHGGYQDLSPFLDYPGDIVNCSLNVGEAKLTGDTISEMFNRPFMGGMERKETIATGTKLEIMDTVTKVLSKTSKPFLLGADCTVPSGTSWDSLKTAIDTAHNWLK